VCVALVTQHAVRSAVLNCHLWPVRLYHFLSRYLINSRIFRGGENVIQHKCLCFLIFSTAFV